MDEKFKRALEVLREDIINDFDPTYIWIGLLEDRGLTDEIKTSMKTTSAKDFEEKRRFWVKKILEVLPTGGNKAFSIFVQNIRRCHQEHLAAALEEQARRPLEVKVNKTPIQTSRSVYADVNMEEFIGLDRLPVQRELFSRIKICDLTSKEQIGVVQVQVVYKAIKMGTKVGDVYSYYVVDDTGGINVIAKGNVGKTLELATRLELKSFCQISTWTLLPRNKEFSSLSNHDFEIRIDHPAWVSPMPGILGTGPIWPFKDIKLTTVDQIPLLTEACTIDVIAIVQKVYLKEKDAKTNKDKKRIELKSSKSTIVKKFSTVQCYLYEENVDFITRQGCIVLIKNAKKSTKNNDCITAGRSSFIFLINDFFEESWLPAEQLELVNALKPKPKAKPRNLSSEIEEALQLNVMPEPMQCGSSSISFGAAVQSSSRTPATSLNASILSSSTPNSKTGQTPGRGAKRKFSLLESVEKKLKSKKLSKLDSTPLSDVRIVKAVVQPYTGCPDDGCTKKVGDPSTTPYMCSGFPCKRSPMKSETKKRYKMQVTICNSNVPEVTKELNSYDKTSRKLFDLVKINPEGISHEQIVEKLTQYTYNMDINGKRKGDASWDLTIENAELSG